MTCRSTKRAWPTGLLIAVGVAISGVAVALPWDLDMADSEAVKGYEREMRPLPAGVVAQPNPLSPVGFSPNMDRMRVLEAPGLLRNPLKQSPDVLAEGEHMFNTYCTPCHGDGHKQLGPVGDPTRFANVVQLAGSSGAISSKPDGYLYLTIRNGGSIMPYYGWAMNDQEMWSIVHYLRTLPNGRFKPKANKETP